MNCFWAHFTQKSQSQKRALALWVLCRTCTADTLFLILSDPSPDISITVTSCGSRSPTTWTGLYVASICRKAASPAQLPQVRRNEPCLWGVGSDFPEATPGFWEKSPRRPPNPKCHRSLLMMPVRLFPGFLKRANNFPFTRLLFALM